MQAGGIYRGGQSQRATLALLDKLPKGQAGRQQLGVPWAALLSRQAAARPPAGLAGRSVWRCRRAGPGRRRPGSRPRLGRCRQGACSTTRSQRRAAQPQAPCGAEQQGGGWTASTAAPHHPRHPTGHSLAHHSTSGPKRMPPARSRVRWVPSPAVPGSGSGYTRCLKPAVPAVPAPAEGRAGGQPAVAAAL